MPEAKVESPTPETAVAPEMTPREESRLDNYPADAREVLKKSKAAKKEAKQAALAAAPRKSLVPELIAPEVKADKPARKEKPAAVVAEEPGTGNSEPGTVETHEAGVIDFGGEVSPKDKPAGEASDAGVVADVTEADLAGVPDEIRKRLLEKNKENAKIRKRAQEAEAKAAELEKAKAEYETKVAALSDEAAKLRTVPLPDAAPGDIDHGADDTGFFDQDI